MSAMSTKKPNKKYVNSVVSSSLQDYYTKAEIDDNYVLRTDLNTAISDLNKAISDLNTAISAIKRKA